MRRVAAALVLGLAVAAAVAVGSYRQTHSASNCSTGSYGSRSGPCSWETRPGWAVPVGIVIAFAGLGVAAAVVQTKEKLRQP